MPHPMTEMASEARLALHAVPASAARARRFVADTLGRWGSSAVAQTAELLVSELVTNGVLHARTDLELVLRAQGDQVRVEVRDGSPATPVVRHYEDDAMTGRGLALVAELAADWGVEERADGKAVWFELVAPARR